MAKENSRHGPKVMAKKGNRGDELAHESKALSVPHQEKDHRSAIMGGRNRDFREEVVPCGHPASRTTVSAHACAMRAAI